ncbi:la-related protein 6B-like isoform X2 [Tasmannia lanceolata]|uniref:la-related protein 6B-like isoform X2 n=1 Tax=Tasmannia lanceolata TaxID=3420 RepID=UPI00406366FE
MAHGSLLETLETSIVSVDQIAISASDRSPSDPSLSRNPSFSRLNAGAPEFVPRMPNHRSNFPVTQPPPPRVVIPQTPSQTQYFGGYGEREIVQGASDQDSGPARDGLSDEVMQKIVNQVEYYFSDANLATTDHLMRFINKDPEGFVPMSVVASFKKIKALASSNPLLANALRNSSKLVVSEDGKKVRRQHPFTDADVEELQSRMVVSENLPEDHSFQNLMKVFSTVGSVKTIRTCPPQTSNGAASAASRSAKMDMLFSNKLHAFVEYETVEQAEKAVAELNDERNWRSGLRVRLLHKRTTKSARGKKTGHEGDWNAEEDDVSTSEHLNEKQPDDAQPSETSHEPMAEENLNDRDGGARKGGRGRGRNKGRGRGQYHNNRGGPSIGTPPSGNSIQNELPIATKQPPGPRMPDGTRGFTLGRGKPLSVTTA